MSQTIILDQKTARDMISAMRELKQEVSLLRRALVAKKPKYGSDEWWEESTKQALKDLENGDYQTFDNVDDLIKSLHA